MREVNDIYSSDTFVDPRPINLITYAILSKASIFVTKPIVMETVANLTNQEALQLLAKKEYCRMLSEPGLTDQLKVSIN